MLQPRTELNIPPPKDVRQLWGTLSRLWDLGRNPLAVLRELWGALPPEPRAVAGRPNTNGSFSKYSG